MMKRVILGDCLDILRDMPDELVHLVYLDPPFFTGKVHSLKSKELQEYQFNDMWNSIEDYIAFLSVRLQEIRRVMKNTACIFFHCDRNASHHIRLLLDEIFGPQRFLSEIIWTYKRWSSSTRTLLPSHQTIYMYSKSEHYTFHTLMQPYSETTNLDQILQKRERDERGKTVYAENETGETIFSGPKQGVPLSDTWAIPYLNPKARERAGYPTQKPLLLLERIIRLASNPEDVILDPFCGSGTTLVAAELLERNYIGIDISEDAVKMTQARLKQPVKSESHLMQKGREAYENLPEYVSELLAPLPVKPVQRNSGIDAIHDQFINGQPIVIRIQRKYEPLIDAATRLRRAGKKKNAALMILVQLENSQQLQLADLMPEDIIIVDSLQYSIQKLVGERTTPVPEDLE